MQRCLASLQPSGSVSRNDRCRHRQERPATQQTVTTGGRDLSSWIPFGSAKGLIGAASRQGERRPRSPHWPLPSSRALFFPSSFSTPRSHGHNHNPSQASDPLEPLVTHSTHQPGRTGHCLVRASFVLLVCALSLPFSVRGARFDVGQTWTRHRPRPRSVRIRT